MPDGMVERGHDELSRLACDDFGPAGGGGMSGGWVYIMTNRANGILYTGVTSDIGRRVYEHREGSSRDLLNDMD